MSSLTSAALYLESFTLFHRSLKSSQHILSSSPLHNWGLFVTAAKVTTALAGSTYSSRICLISLLSFTDKVLELSLLSTLQSVSSKMASTLPNQVDTFLACLS